jgi:putative phosphoesterase
MTKTLILSDIHSNIYALEAIWKDEGDSDRVYCTGDLVDYGPFPREVLNWVRDHGVICTQGNHDRWLVVNYQSGILLEHLALEERAWVHHNAALLSDNDIQYLSSLPRAVRFQQAGVQYGLTHLYKDYLEIDNVAAFDEFCERAFPGTNPHPISCLILGHTHRQKVCRLSDDRMWFNPGSVSYRRRDDPDQTAHYALIIDGEIKLKKKPYDLSPLRRYVNGVSLKESELEVARWFFGQRS